jgi:hypothetical protein
MPVALQNALSDLAPRYVGPLIAEPSVEFDEVQQALHSAERCAYTCGCRSGTNVCVTTGNSES